MKRTNTIKPEIKAVSRLKTPRDVLIVMNLVSYRIPKNLLVPIYKDRDLLLLNVVVNTHSNNEDLADYIRSVLHSNKQPHLKKYSGQKKGCRRCLINKLAESWFSWWRRSFAEGYNKDREVIKAVINEVYLQGKVSNAERELEDGFRRH